MRVLAFRHSPSDGLGLIGGVLDAHGIASQYTDLYDAPAEATDIEDADALILLGGSMSANDNLSFIQRESNTCKPRFSRANHYLGICLGAQVIAKALGSKVYSNGTKEIGWAPVMFTGAARNDASSTG